MKRILITGVTGFVGRHLAALLASSKNVRIHGLAQETPARAVREWGAAVPVCWHRGDLQSRASLRAALRASRPDRVVHLAAQTFVPQSWKDPDATIRTNVVGSLHLFEAVRDFAPEARILVAGSGDVYGAVAPRDLPIRETLAPKPLNPYSFSKAAQELLALQMHRAGKLRVICTRTFTHTGPGQSDAFVVSAFARQVASIEAGLAPGVLRVGNLDAVRDFLDVRDVVRAYAAAAERCPEGEVYNICSGTGRRIRQVLDLLLRYTTAKIEVRLDGRRLRPSDTPKLIGDPSKFRRATGWKPAIAFEQTVLDVLNDWRGRLRHQAARRRR